MSWIYGLLFLAGFATLWRVYYGIRKMKEKREKDWDERLIRYFYRYSRRKELVLGEAALSQGDMGKTAGLQLLKG